MQGFDHPNSGKVIHGDHRAGARLHAGNRDSRGEPAVEALIPGNNRAWIEPQASHTVHIGNLARLDVSERRPTCDVSDVAVAESIQVVYGALDARSAIHLDNARALSSQARIKETHRDLAFDEFLNQLVAHL